MLERDGVLGLIDPANIHETVRSAVDSALSLRHGALAPPADDPIQELRDRAGVDHPIRGDPPSPGVLDPVAHPHQVADVMGVGVDDEVHAAGHRQPAHLGRGIEPVERAVDLERHPGDGKTLEHRVDVELHPRTSARHSGRRDDRWH